MPTWEFSRQLRDFDSCALPMWIYDRGTLAFLEVNDAAVRFYGYSRSDFLRMTILDIRPAADIRKVMLTALQDEPSNGQIWRHQKQDGSTIQVRITYTEIEFVGRPARMVTAVEIKEDARSGAGISPKSPKSASARA